MNGSCHTWMSHNTHTNDSIIYEGVLPYMKKSCQTMHESCLTESSRVMYEWDMAYVNRYNVAVESRHFTQRNNSLNIWLIFVTRMHESYRTYESVVLYARVVSQTNASLHIWMIHVTHMNESGQKWIGHAKSHIYESCHAYASLMCECALCKSTPHEWNRL